MRDLGFGIVASVIANVNRDPKKKKDPFTAEDFMPMYSGSKKNKEPTAEDLLEKWTNLVVPSVNAVVNATQQHG